MGFLKRDDSSSQRPAEPDAAVAVDQTNGPIGDAPQAGAYDSASLAGVPESGRERIPL